MNRLDRFVMACGVLTLFVILLELILESQRNASVVNYQGARIDIAINSLNHIQKRVCELAERIGGSASDDRGSPNGGAVDPPTGTVVLGMVQPGPQRRAARTRKANRADHHQVGGAEASPA
jgi:hypothetical protein